MRSSARLKMVSTKIPPDSQIGGGVSLSADGEPLSGCPERSQWPRPPSLGLSWQFTLSAPGRGSKGRRAGEGTRPYGMCRSVLSFRRGRTLAGPPRNGTQLSRAAQCAAPTQIPERSQTNPRAHTVRPYGIIRTGTVGSSKPGAGVEPHLS